MAPAPPVPFAHHQVAYGLNEDQMRRWGLYVSTPLGTEESGGPFSGALAPRLRVPAPAPAPAPRPRPSPSALGGPAEPGSNARQPPALMPELCRLGACLPVLDPPLLEPALFLVNPAGLLHVMVGCGAPGAAPGMPDAGKHPAAATLVAAAATAAAAGLCRPRARASQSPPPFRPPSPTGLQ